MSEEKRTYLTVMVAQLTDERDALKTALATATAERDAQTAYKAVAQREVMALRTTVASLRADLGEACDWAEQFGNARLVASPSDLGRIAALRATAEGADE